MNWFRTQVKFYYPINLHYSQTIYSVARSVKLFYYPINLHYSQTGITVDAEPPKFYYPINLHYSQTYAHCTGIMQCFTTL